MRFIEVTKALVKEPENVVINVAHIISIEAFILEKAEFIGGKKILSKYEYRNVICRDNRCYVISVEDAKKLIGGE